MKLTTSYLSNLYKMVEQHMATFEKPGYVRFTIFNATIVRPDFHVRRQQHLELSNKSDTQQHDWFDLMERANGITGSLPTKDTH